jgi:uncharacterized membrane protein AbrB (regulator of aidB expression)
MTIMAFALGFDPAFVGGHHVIRIIMINLFISLWLPAGRRAVMAIGKKERDCDESGNLGS